jgi:amino acid adenylation domain-containing protein
MIRPRTLPELLFERANERPNETLYTFLRDGEAAEEGLTYEQLVRRAWAVALQIRQRVPAGERVVLLYPPGLDYIVGFWGALCAGVTAIPAYPPDPMRLPRTLPRLAAIVADSGARVLLTNATVAPFAGALGKRAPELAACEWIATDGMVADAQPQPSPAGDPDGLAFLQYTSGSTGVPKGVMLTHANLLQNSAVIAEAFSTGPRHKAIIWLPPYHDMGLIGGIVQPLFGRFQAVLMSPLSFLERPLRWLRAIAHHRGTISGGPNFAYDLCVRKSTPAERAGLDLSGWEVAFTGAEPVRAATIDRFSAAFADCGFRREAFYPCYGLAESTLIVSGSSPGAGPAVLQVSRAALGDGRVAAPAGEADDVAVVASGRPLPSCETRIVDPESGGACLEGTIGEIWVSGPSVARGYWRRPGLSGETFGARIAGDEQVYLRTGDLGFLRDGQLYVTGRRKDVIIVRGRNHYPDDIERTVEAVHGALRPGCGVAFSVEHEGEERAAVVQEIDVRRLEAAPENRLHEIASEIRRAVAQQHDLAPAAVILIRPGTVPKTSSGKLQRFEVKRAYLSGALEVVAQWSEGATEPAVSEPLPSSSSARGDDADSSTVWLRAALARLTHTAPARVDPNAPLGALGLDSMAAVSLRSDIEDEFGVLLPLGPLLGGSMISIGALLEEARRNAVPGPLRISTEAPPVRASLSRGQQALWVLHRSAPQSTAYNLSRTLRLDGIDVARLREALARVVYRHPIVTARFGSDEREPHQLIHESASLDIRVEDAQGWSKSEVQALIEETALSPFDLERAGAFRARLIDLGAGQCLLVLAAHHIVVDLWSLAVLVQELGETYGALARGDEPRLPAPGTDYRAFVSWQRALLAGPSGVMLREYWAKRLAGAPPRLEIPGAREEPSASPTLCWRRELAFSSDVHAFARQQGITTFAAMLSAFGLALRRYTGEPTLVVGCPVSGRARHAFQRSVGYFSNVLPLRLAPSPEETVAAFARRTMDVMAEALSHEDLPFVDIVQVANPTRRDVGSSLVSVLFCQQEMDASRFGNLAALALDIPDRTVEAGPLKMTTVRGATPRPPVDLVVSVAEVDGKFSSVVEADPRVYDKAAASAVTETWVACLQEMTRDPTRTVADLAPLCEADRSVLAASGRGEAIPVAASSIPSVVAAVAERDADRVAVSADAGDMTYGELYLHVQALALRLRAMGLGPERLAVVCVERSPDLLIALLAVMATGAAYLPVDPAHPVERIVSTVRRATATLAIATATTQPLLSDSVRPVVLLDAAFVADPPRTGVPVPLPPVSGSALAYVLYTSGSTGQPKGVEVSRASLGNFLQAMLREPGITADDRLLAVTTATFDIAALELYLPLSVGATVVLASRETAQDGYALARKLDASEITMMQATPVTWRMLVGAGWRPRGRFVALCGGEALPPDLAADLRARGVTLYNMYGPTETTVWSTMAKVDRIDRGRVAIGRPVANTDVLVVDERLRLLPVGAIGELCIGGAGVARGYRGRPELTAERFVPHPLGSGERVYRTGDRCRIRRDGTLEYVGRDDTQIKIRGFRVELGEIEAALLEDPGVAGAAVVAQGEDAAARRLIAYVVGREEVDVEALKALARRKLPGYMVPAEVVPLSALPLTANGKVDRKMLAGRATATSPRSAPVAPRSELERALHRAWSESFGGRELGVLDDFFDLGGHSLLAMEVVTRIRRALRIDVSVQAIFETRHIAALAERLAPSAWGAPALVQTPVAEHPVAGRQEGPLSDAQRSLWLLSQLDDAPAYHMAAAFRVRGPLDAALLEASLRAVISRHEALRTVFQSRDGVPVQIVGGTPARSIAFVEIVGRGGESAVEAAQRWIEEEARRPFDLGAGPLFRASLLRLGDEDHFFVAVLHHIVADGESLRRLVLEVSRDYQAQLAGDPMAEAPARPYLDYVAWQADRAQAQGPAMAYWREHLQDYAPLVLPTDRPRPAVPSLGGARHQVEVHPDLLAAVTRVAHANGATPFMVLLAAFQAFLHRYTGQEDVWVGTAVSTRSDPRFASAVGLFINTVGVKATVDPRASFGALVTAVRRSTLEAFEHGEIPLEQVMDVLRSSQTSAGTGPFRVAFTMDDGAALVPVLGGATVEPVPVETGGAKFELALTASVRGGAATLSWEYRTALFDEPTVRRMAGSFQALLEDAVSRPSTPVGRLRMLGTSERREQTDEWNETAQPYPSDRCVHHLVERWAAKTPSAEAVVHGTRTLSYGELNDRATRLAARVRRRGIGLETVVGLALERSPELIVGMLAIMKAGGAFVVLDPSYPRERHAALVREADIRTVLTRAHLLEPLALAEEGRSIVLIDEGDEAGDVADGKAELSTGSTVGSANIVYVLHTSGSTGTPKGIALPHRAVVRLVSSNCALVEPGDRFAQMSAMSFDAAQYEIWTTLCRGATLVIVDTEVVLSPSRFARELAESRITAFVMATSLLNLMAREAPSAFEHVRYAFFGGEAGDAGVLRRILEGKRPGQLVNLYGPAEGSSVSTAATLELADVQTMVPIGRPISNTRAYVLDRAMECVPPGAVGELYLGGDGLARGYWNRPALTAAAFLPDPFAPAPGGRLYRTGDLVRQRADGTLEFVGRVDDQLKIRGFRIEPSEVAVALLGDQAVAEAVVVGRQDPLRGPFLSAYVVPRSPGASVDEIVARLRERIPDFMIPAAFTVLPRIPLTANGKVDTRALPEAVPARQREYVEPTTPTERLVASTIAEVLGVSSVGATDSFIDLGGHSLMATQVASRLTRAASKEVSIRMVFEEGNVRRLAARIDRLAAADTERTIPRAPRRALATSGGVQANRRRTTPSKG